MSDFPKVSRPANGPKRDIGHEMQLRRDLSIINERVMQELGPLPPDGVPVQPKRKPSLPYRPPPSPPAPIVEVSSPPPAFLPEHQEADMFKLSRLFNRKPREPWPLWFNNFSFGARCYNTLRCSIIFAKHQHSLHFGEPSGQPRTPNWKDNWTAGFGILSSEFQRHGFPSPVDIDWTSLDGTKHQAEIDLENVFPDRLILHKVPRDEVRERWETSDSLRCVDILLEVNDRTISIYMRAWVVTKHLQDPNDPNSDERRDLMLAWTRTY